MKMGSWRLQWQLLFLRVINLVALRLTISQPQLLAKFCNHTSNNIYQTNLNAVLSSLAPNIDKYGFYNASDGEIPNRANAIVLCRADIELQNCRACIKNSITALTQLCPDEKQAIGWYDDCMLRYSNESMYGIMKGDPRIFVWSQQNVTSSSVEMFDLAVTTLLGSLQGQAASGGSLRKFASRSAAGPDSLSVYAYTQCTPDISEQDCCDCLQEAIRNFPLCCNGRKGGRVIRPSCQFRYEIGPFLGEIPADAPAAPPTSLSSPPPPPTSPAPPSVASLNLFIYLYIYIYI